MKNKDILTVFIDRMKKLDIEVKLTGNFPWIYVDSVNGNRIKKEDYFLGNHGFTLAFYPIKTDQKLEFTDISKLIDLVRKYK
jgi:hypothetical protein